MNDKVSAEKTADWDEILQAIRWDKDGLIPVVVRDEESGQVLMLAYINREALIATLTGGKACYFSRSRQKLWIKGETSGNYQEVVSLRFDCDKDAALLTVRQTGMACHENYFSCFHNTINMEAPPEKAKQKERTAWLKSGEPNIKPALSLGRIMELLTEVIKQRKKEKPEGSYTAYLFSEGTDKILKKLGEECAEVIIAAKNNSPGEICYETADLLYHLLVLLEDRGIAPEKIAEELSARRK